MLRNKAVLCIIVDAESDINVLKYLAVRDVMAQRYDFNSALNSC